MNVVWKKILMVVSVVSLILIVMIFPLRFYVYNESFYYEQFTKNDVHSNIGDVNISEVLDNLFSFFKDSEDLVYFTDSEQDHLLDVKIIFDKFFFILNVSLFLLISSFLILFFIDKANFSDIFLKSLFLGGLCSFVLIALLTFAALNFSTTFSGFHKLFFPQGNYSFPFDFLLIKLFPESFFKSFFMKLLSRSLLFSLFLMLPLLILKKIKGKIKD